LATGNTFRYSWYLYSGINYVAVTSVSKDPRTFKLAAQSLSASKDYTVVAQVTSSSTNKSATAFVSVTVGRAGLVASILGGDTLTHFYNSTLVLDASGSYDIDYPTTGKLSYSWTCIQYAPSYGGTCNLTLSKTAVLSVGAGRLTASSNYSFTVYAQSSDGYTSSASVLVSVVVGKVPMLSVSNLVSKVPLNTKLVIGATISVVAAASATWSCSNCPFTVPTLSSQTFDPSGSDVVTASYPVIIPANTLSGGKSYTFTLSSSYSGPARDPSLSYATVSSSITIVVNSIPSGGQLTVSPITGRALDTSFLLSTQLWIDDVADYPLQYSFSYFVRDVSSAVIVQSRSLIQFVYSTLGQGLESNKYAVTCVVVATDTNGASSNTTAPVIVNPVKDPYSLGSYVSTSLESAGTNFDGNAILQVVGGVVASVNAANCSLAVNCAKLNRNKCSTTAQTCGPCLSGFSGISQDSNHPCVNSSSTHLFTSNAACASDYDCIFGNCVKGLCVTAQKVCPNDCSGVGDCTYTNTLGSSLASCSTQDIFCTATCKCNTGYYGYDCSLSQKSLAAAKSLRELMCSSMLASLSFQVL